MAQMSMIRLKILVNKNDVEITIALPDGGACPTSAPVAASFGPKILQLAKTRTKKNPTFLRGFLNN
jgi:hypothetical protein